MRAVGFYPNEGGYVDNVLGPTLMGDDDQRGRRRGRPEHLSDQSGGRLAGLLDDQPGMEPARPRASTSAARRMGTGTPTRSSATTRSRASSTSGATTSGTRRRATLKGDLGFAELSVTASLLRPQDRLRVGQHELRPVAHRTNYRLLPTRLYDTGTLHAVTFNYQKQNRWAYEARLTSQGESKLQWMAGAFYEDVYDWWEYGDRLTGDLPTRAAWEAAQNDRLRAHRATRRSQPARWPRRDDLLLQQLSTTRSSSSPSSAR